MPYAGEEFLPDLERALTEEWGLALTTDNGPSVRRKLYALRIRLRKEGEKKFDGLQIVISPNDANTVWILARKEDESGKDNGKS